MGRNRANHRSDIIKGDIVWYWYREIREWRKGKVIAVNRHYLTIKNRATNHLYYAPSYQWCVSASQPKPTEPAPGDLWEAWKRRGWEWVNGVFTQVRKVK